MNELKPVAWMWEYRGFAMVTANEAKAMELQEDQEIEVTPLYAIPEQVKSKWHADILESTSIQIAAGKTEATNIQIATALLEESKRIRQRTQDAGNANPNNPPA